MQISNEQKNRKIELVKIESQKEHFPSHHVLIIIQTENIQSCIDNYTWLGENDIEDFIRALISLEKTRKGHALLESLTPGEFLLSFKAIDSLGHLSVSCNYKTQKTLSDYKYNVAVEFEIDPTSLPLVVNELTSFIK